MNVVALIATAGWKPSSCEVTRARSLDLSSNSLRSIAQPKNMHIRHKEEELAARLDTHNSHEPAGTVCTASTQLMNSKQQPNQAIVDSSS